MNDKEIIDLFWQRDEHAIEELAASYGVYCHSISYHILENRQDTEECLNDTWLKAWNSMPPVRPSNLRVYVGKIIRNLSLDVVLAKSAAKRGKGAAAAVYEELEQCLGTSDPIEHMIDRHIFRSFINEFLARQTPLKRTVFVQRFWYLYTPAQISRSCNLKEKTVYNMLYHLRSEFKAQWQQEIKKNGG